MNHPTPLSLPLHKLAAAAGATPLPPPQVVADDIAALYVHIPFCFHKCHYCDFYSITRQSPQRMERFVDLLLLEGEQWRQRLGRSPRVRTIFFGGGTPSLLPRNEMQRLLSQLPRTFDLSDLEEWTVEVNPATAERDYCQTLRDYGVDRLSFGAQSFNPDELKTLERHHHPEDVERSLEMARSAGFGRLNVDLIYAIPGQTLASWEQSLERAVALQTPHVSCYNLTYEPNTPMAVRRRLGHFTAVEETVELQMFHHARRRLAASGRDAYEISNYATPGEACRHNLLYWTGANYIGLGPSAASHVSGHRWRNRPHLGEWERCVAAGQWPAIDVEHLTAPQRQGELAMLMLRLSGGINFAEFTGRTGADARAVFADQIARLGKVGLLRQDAGAICLTETGLSVADAVAAEFLAPA